MPITIDQGNTDQKKNPTVIEVHQLSTRFGNHVVHADLDLDVRQGEIYAIVGGSGSGKSTLLQEMIILHRPDSGSIKILNTDIMTLSKAGAHALRQRWGFMFQHGGLFGTLNVRDNVGLPLREHTDLGDEVIDKLAAWKITLSGLAPEAGLQYPTELSGGMLKRASMARALALDPELLFLDEPTASLDPAGASGIDTLVRSLHELYQSTIVIITHDLDFFMVVHRSGRCAWPRQGGRGRLNDGTGRNGSSCYSTILRWTTRQGGPGAGANPDRRSTTHQGKAVDTKVNYAVVGVFVLALGALFR